MQTISGTKLSMKVARIIHHFNKRVYNSDAFERKILSVFIIQGLDFMHLCSKIIHALPKSFKQFSVLLFAVPGRYILV